MKNCKRRIDHEFNFEAYNSIFETATEIFREITRASRNIPKERVYLADLARRHSRLVCINLEEAWRMKEHKMIFLNKLSDAAQAASKTQDVLKFASKYKYIDGEVFKKIDTEYDRIFDDIFIMLCDGKKMTDDLEGSGSKESALRETVSVG